MISHSRKCIFVHIPKTGGTSIEDLIWPDRTARTKADLWQGFVDKYNNKYQTGGLQHLLARQIRQEVGTDVFSSYFSFAMVRNPWDKAVSQYVYMGTRKDLCKFIGMKTGDSFKKYLSLIAKKAHVQWAPQVDFTHDADDCQLVNYIGRFESFSATVHYILDAVGMKTEAIPHEKRGARKPYQDYYDAESKQMLDAMYATDIRTFDYAFDTADAAPLAASAGAPVAIAAESPRAWTKALEIVGRLRGR